MTSQFDFTNSEWNDIAVLPVLVGFAIARAEDSGRIGSIREVRALTHGIAAKVNDNAAKSLIDAVATIDVQNKLDEFDEHPADLLGDVAVQASRQIANLLTAKAEPAEVAGYTSWVLGIAHDVAETAREHGVRISEPEANLLARLHQVLD